MVYSPKGNFIYGSSQTETTEYIDAFSVDATTGILTQFADLIPPIQLPSYSSPPGATAGGMTAANVRSDGNACLYLTVDTTIYPHVIDATTGNLTLLSTSAGFANSDYQQNATLYTGRQMAIYNRPGNKWLYVANSGANTVTHFALDTVGMPQVNSNAVSTMANTPFAVAVHPTLDTLYQIGDDAGTKTLKVWHIDALTGALGPVVGTGGYDAYNFTLNDTMIAFQDMAVSPDGKTLWVTGQGGSTAYGVVGFDLEPTFGLLAGSPRLKMQSTLASGLAFLQPDALTTLLFTAVTANGGNTNEINTLDLLSGNAGSLGVDYTPSKVVVTP